MKQQLEWTGSKVGKVYEKAVYCHPVYIYAEYVCMLSHFSHVQLFVILWTVAHQSPLTMEFSRQEYWNELPCPPGDLPDPGIEPASLMSPALAGRFFKIALPGKPYMQNTLCKMPNWMNYKLESRLLGEIINNLWYTDDITSNGRKWRGTKEPLDKGERQK